MIVATAGHIDHGKTALVRALTGIDADRLPEEKRRGMTIDLGFAYSPLRDGTTILGFVDVPGHERFVRNMLAGVSGIDFALLVVAADDGPMPQTREHLAILDLLGVTRGAVAVTKIDRVTPERVTEVAAEIGQLLAGTGLAGAPAFPLSNITGEGIAALRALLERDAAGAAARAARGHFRLAVDRCFTLHGAGLIVTGTAFAGSVKVGDRLVLSPLGHDVRVRGIHAQNRETHAAVAGQRCALNLAGTGLSKELVARGDWVVAEEIHAPTRRLDATIRMLEDGSPLGMRDRMPVHLHLGAADVTGRVALLEDRPLLPGEGGRVRILLDRAIHALYGDRFVLRDQSAQQTIGGGRVIDPFGPERGRRRPERLAMLDALAGEDVAQALAAAIEQAPAGVDLAAFARARNLTAAEQGALWRRVPMRRLGEGETAIGLAERYWHEYRNAVLDGLAAWHTSHPDLPGADPERLRLSLPQRPAKPVSASIVAALVEAGEAKRAGGMLSLPGHSAAMSGADAALWAKVEPLLAAGGLRPPRVREIAEQLKTKPEAVEKLLRRVARQGLVYPVADNRFFPPQALASLARIAEEVAEAAPDGAFTAAAYKDRTGIGRNVAIELLEFFDEKGFTRRHVESRRIVKPAAELFPS